METKQTTTTNKDMGDIMLVHSTSMSPVIITTNESSDATAMIERFWIDTLTSARIHMLQADSPKCTYSFKYEFNRKTPKCLLHLCIKNFLTGEETFLYARPLL